MRRQATVLVLLCLGLSSALAEDFWVKKSWTEWSQTEAKKMLEDSPWAREYTTASVQIGQYTGGGSSAAAARGMETNVKTKYVVQFRSALPLRQAVVRTSQISMKYDAMKPEQRKSFDDSAKNYIDQQFPNTVAVYVTYECTNPSWNQDLVRYWGAMTRELALGKAYLITPKGERLAPLQYMLGQGQSFQMVFPRPTDLPADGSVKVELSLPGLGNANSQRGGQDETHALLEFKLKKMVFGNELVF